MGKRQRLTKKITELVGETGPPSPQQANTVPLPSQPKYATHRSKLVTNQGSSSTRPNEDEVSAQNQSNFEIDSGHPSQVSDAALKDARRCKRAIPAATPVSVRSILQETNDDESSQTRSKIVAEEPTAESPLQNKVSRPSGTNTINSKDFDSLASKSWSDMRRCTRSPELQQSIPMDLSEEHVPQTEVNAAHNAHSFNMTEEVEKMHCYTLHDDEEEEVGSSVDPALVNVQGYQVKPEIAPLLSKIFNEHGDIVSNCELKYMRVYFLESVCSLYYKLQNTSFGKIRASNLKEMTDTVDELEKMGVNVTWLSKRLDEISSTINFLKTYASMKVKELKTKELIGVKEKEIEQHAVKLATLQNIMSTYQRKKSAIEEELLQIKVEAEKFQGMRLKASTFLKIKCLADGLV